MRRLEDNSFVLLLLLVSIAFAWVVEPFFGAVLWAVIVAIIFAPLHERMLARMPGRTNLAATITLLAIAALVVLPAILLTIALLQEMAGLYERIQRAAINPDLFFQRIQDSLPGWLKSLLDSLGLSDLDAVRAKLASGITASLQSLTLRVLGIGQSAFGFIVAIGAMLYLAFFFLRDGRPLAERIEKAIPLDPELRSALFAKFTMVVRAMIKGTIVVAFVQGAVGGIVFWVIGLHSPLLWGVAMGFMSLLPAVGAGIIWVPVAVYLLVTGAFWQGIVLLICGFGVISLIDNILRPMLVGRDTRLPDYLVLIATLGGLEAIGFNGLIVGPVIAALFISSWEIFARVRSGNGRPSRDR